MTANRGGPHASLERVQISGMAILNKSCKKLKNVKEKWPVV
jgi:hypothetical protein